MNLEDFEPTIVGVARRYAQDPEQMEDYAQIGRVAAWQLLQEKPSVVDVSYVDRTISHAVTSEIMHQRSRVRNPGTPILPLEEEILEEHGYSPTVLNTHDGGVSSRERMLAFLQEELKARYGGRRWGRKRWATGLRDKEADPETTVRRIVRHVIEDIYGISQEEVPRHVSQEFFREAGLDNLLNVFYRRSPIAAVMDAYRGETLPFDFRIKPRNFWSGNQGVTHRKQALRWFAIRRSLESAADCRDIGKDDFEREGLATLLDVYYASSPYLALREVFPDLKPWGTRKTKRNFFDSEEERLRATIAFLQSQGKPSLVGLSPEETYDQGLRKTVTVQALQEFGLSSLLMRYRNSTYRLFADVFPEQILPWTLPGRAAWRDDPEGTTIRAIRWLFDDYLVIPPELIPSYASADLFKDLGLSSIRHRGTGTIFGLLNTAYPGTFTRAQFNRNRKIIKLPKKRLVKKKK